MTKSMDGVFYIVVAVIIGVALAILFVKWFLVAVARRDAKQEIGRIMESLSALEEDRQPARLPLLSGVPQRDPPESPRLVREPKTTDYCKGCGESPESGTHIFGHTCVPPDHLLKKDNG